MVAGEGITSPSGRDIDGRYLDQNEQDLKTRYIKIQKDWPLFGIRIKNPRIAARPMMMMIVTVLMLVVVLVVLPVVVVVLVVFVSQVYIAHTNAHIFLTMSIDY